MPSGSAMLAPVLASGPPCAAGCGGAVVDVATTGATSVEEDAGVETSVTDVVVVVVCDEVVLVGGGGVTHALTSSVASVDQPCLPVGSSHALMWTMKVWSTVPETLKVLLYLSVKSFSSRTVVPSSTCTWFVLPCLTEYCVRLTDTTEVSPLHSALTLGVWALATPANPMRPSLTPVRTPPRATPKLRRGVELSAKEASGCYVWNGGKPETPGPTERCRPQIRCVG